MLPAQTESSGADLMSTSGIPMQATEAAEAVSQLYGLAVTALPLTSERDQNFQLRISGIPQYLLKLANAAESEAIFDFKTSALRHIAAVAPGLPVQRVLETLDGRPHFFWAAVDGRRRLGCVLTYLQGMPMASLDRNAAQIRSLGTLAAELGRALSDFSHPASGHELLWDLKHAAQLRPYLNATASSPHYDVVARSLDAFENCVLPCLPNLRSQVIHNDLNPYNIMIAAQDTDRASGVIDFGDMVHGALVTDVAVTCSYLFGDGADPLAPICHFLSAYAAVRPLHEAEYAILPDLIATRLAMTVIITNWRAAQYPENAAYILRNQPSAVRGLEILTSLSIEDVRTRFRCGSSS
jgi:Ser/Thr protein kinase RdoA (MazF antagonist)